MYIAEILTLKDFQILLMDLNIMSLYVHALITLVM